MNAILEPYRLILGHREILWRAVRSALLVRYAGSILGLGWIAVGPLLLLALYAVIYAVIFQIRPLNMTITEYIVYIFAGLIPFIAFSQSLASGTNSLVQDHALLLNKVFPAELIPLREVLASAPMILVAGSVAIAYKLAVGEPSLAWILLPLVLLLFAMAVTGIVWIFSLVNLVAKDIQQLITYLVIMMLIASPIAYTPDMIPSNLKFIIFVNPLSFYVMSFQQILVLNQVPDLEVLAGAFVVALISFHGAYRVFKVGKLVIADHV